MHVVVTRTQPGAYAFIQRLGLAGYRASAMPVLQTKPTHMPPPVPLAGISTIIITSTHAPGFLPEGTLHGRTVYAIGPESARAALAHGAQRIITAGGNSHALAACVRAHPVQGLALLAGAQKLSPGALGRLLEAGCPVAHWPVYETVAADFDIEALKILCAQQDEVTITLHSQKAASIFAARVHAHLPDEYTQKMSLLCLSPAVLECIASARCKRAYSARTPDEDALIQALQKTSPL